MNSFRVSPLVVLGAVYLKLLFETMPQNLGVCSYTGPPCGPYRCLRQVRLHLSDRLTIWTVFVRLILRKRRAALSVQAVQQ